jgi:ATP-dependent exoDNAse (exonuclease V) alpha subunit
LVADWLAAHRAGDEALMISTRLAEAAALSRAARAELVRAGEVGGPARYLPCGPVSAGDRVMALRNDAALGVQNGMRATVLGLAPDGGLRAVSDAGAIVRLPREYLDARHLAYGYAVTAHKAQGMTVDRAFVLGSSGMHRQWAYTALSRARGESHLYLAADDRTRLFDRAEVGGRDVRPRTSPLARLAYDFDREASKEFASWRAAEREPHRRVRGMGLRM